MSFISRLFGGSKAADKVIDTISGGLDKLSYTHQEKAENHAKDVSEGRQLLLRWIESTSGSRLARRLIALSVTWTWLAQKIISIVIDVAAVFVDDADKLNEASKIIVESSDDMKGAVMLILAFYFAAPHMDKVVDSAMKRFSGNS